MHYKKEKKKDTRQEPHQGSLATGIEDFAPKLAKFIIATCGSSAIYQNFKTG